MPVLDGYAFIEAFRRRPEARDLPIIVITAARESAGAVERLRRSGVICVLQKPFDVEALLAAVAD